MQRTVKPWTVRCSNTGFFLAGSRGKWEKGQNFIQKICRRLTQKNYFAPEVRIWRYCFRRTRCQCIERAFEKERVVFWYSLEHECDNLRCGNSSDLLDECCRQTVERKTRRYFFFTSLQRWVWPAFGRQKNSVCKWERSRAVTAFNDGNCIWYLRARMDRCATKKEKWMSLYRTYVRGDRWTVRACCECKRWFLWMPSDLCAERLRIWCFCGAW